MADDWATVGGGNDWQMVEPPKKFGLGDTWPARLAKDIYSYATYPGDVAQGKAAVPTSDSYTPPGTLPENFDRLTGLAGLGTMGTLAPGGATAARTVAAPLPQPGPLKQAGVDVFDAVKNVATPPAQMEKLSSQIENYLMGDRGFRNHPISAQATLEEIKNIATAKNIGDVRSSRMALGEYAKEINPITGKATPNAAAASAAMGHVDDYLSSLAPELRAANANYSAGSTIDTLNFRKTKAEHDTQMYGTGTNLENKMRQQVNRVPDRSLSEYEQLLKNQIVEGDPLRNSLRKAGKAGFGDGLSIMGHTLASVASGGTWLPFALGATGARKIGEQLTKNDIADLAAAIARRSPLYQSNPTMTAPISPLLLRGTAGGQQLLPPPTGLLGQLGLLPTRADNQY